MTHLEHARPEWLLSAALRATQGLTIETFAMHLH